MICKMKTDNFSVGKNDVLNSETVYVFYYFKMPREEITLIRKSNVKI